MAASKFHYTKINKKYKWVLDVPYERKWWFYQTKPKKLLHGYELPNGERIVCKGLRLLTREQYIKECREYDRGPDSLYLSGWQKFLETTYSSWRRFCDYILH